MFIQFKIFNRSCINFFDKTKELGTEELKRRYTAEREALTVPHKPRRPIISSSISDTEVRRDDSVDAVAETRGTIDGSQHVDVTSTTRVSKQHTKNEHLLKNKS